MAKTRRMLFPPSAEDDFKRLFYRDEVIEEAKVFGYEVERPIKETVRSVIRGCRAILEVQMQRKPAEENLPIVLELVSDFCRKARNVERRIRHQTSEKKQIYDWSIGYFLGGGLQYRMGLCCSKRECFEDLEDVETAIWNEPIEESYDWNHVVKAFEAIRTWMHSRGYALIERVYQIYGSHGEAGLAEVHEKFKYVMDTVSSDRIRRVEDLLKMEELFEEWWNGEIPNLL